MAMFNQANHWQLQQLQKAQRSLSKKLKSEDPEPEEIVQEEILTEPIVGLRVWNVETRGGMSYLRSTFKTEFVWPYRKPMEQDIVSNMGIHAIKPNNKMPEDVWYSLGVEQPCTIEGLISAYHPSVMGEVYLWGKVEEHDYGYLAQFAYPKRLWVSPKMDVVTFMQLEDEYGVACDTHESLTPEASLRSGLRTATAVMQQMYYSNAAMLRLQKTYYSSPAWLP